MIPRDRPRRKPLLYAGVSLLVTTTVFFYLFSQITWRQVMDLIVSMDRPLVGWFFLLSLAMHIARTLRYRVILLSVGQDPGFPRLFLTVIVRALCVDLLPARIGELVYIYILRVKLGVELGAAIASFALAFLFDLLALAPILAAALVTVGTGNPLSPWVLGATGLALLVLSGLLIHFLPLALKLGFRACAFLPAAPGRLRAWACRFMASTHRQVRRAKARGVYGRVFGLSIAVRLLKYGALYALLLALLKPGGLTPDRLPFPKVFLGLCSAEMAASLPVSGLGGFGAYEGAWSLVFRLLGFPAEIAMATGVSHHLFSQVYGYLLGLTALVLLQVLPRRIHRPDGSASARRAGDAGLPGDGELLS
jgi:uncharacterized membrane protein YbhN (UPF0104 family)